MRCLTTRNRRNLKTTHRIPLDVILEILSWLPAKYALRFKCVCKEWYNLINSQFFAKLHLNKLLKSDSRHNNNHSLFCTATLRIVHDFSRPSKWTKLNWPKDILRLDKIYTEVVGSCNGLVCFKIFKTPVRYAAVIYFLICNPTTSTFKLILPSSEKTWTDDYFLRYGFGYDSEHDDYKIVVTSSVWTEGERSADVCIYSMKVDSWRGPSTPRSRVYSSELIINWENRQNAIFKDKTLHYLVPSELSEVSKDYRIARFDVVTEKWRDDLCFPAQLKGNPVRLGELDGLLYLRGGRHLSEVWIMEEDGCSWKKMFDIPTKFCRDLIALSKDKRPRLLLQNRYGHGELEWYDHQANKTVPFSLKSPIWYSSVILCMASLVTISGCSSEKLHVIKKKRVKRRPLGCIGLSSE